MKIKLVPAEKTFQPIGELSAEHRAQHTDRKEEAGWRADPLRVIGCKSPCRNHTMNVRMMLQVLAPGMENAQEAYFSAEVLRVCRDLEQCLRTGVEQEIVNNPLVLERQCGHIVWECEDDVEVGNGKQIS